jgi:hypothetical protein
MPDVKQRFALRIARRTAFLRFDAGLVQGQEPQEGDPERERLLREQVELLQSALSESQSALSESQSALSVARWQLESPASNMPQRWFWTAYIVSDKHRFVFMATYKVATTSILVSLLPLFDFDVEGEDFDNLAKGPRFDHNGVRFEDIHHLFSEHSQINKAHFLAGLGTQYHRYFKFAFVRNPWDRLVSCYMSKIVHGGTGMKMGKYGEVTLRSDMSFGEFVEAVCRVPDEVADPHFRSQHVTICDDGPGKAVLADFVGRFENLEEDFGVVAQKIGLRAGLSHTNKSENTNSLSYRDFYDDRLAKMVGERYREDADLFDYSF